MGAIRSRGLGRPLTAANLRPACSAASKSRPFLRPGRGRRLTKRRRRVGAAAARTDSTIGAGAILGQQSAGGPAASGPRRPQCARPHWHEGPGGER
eukprot:8666654-Alexandrium_andersonii.AAC.1